MSKVLERKSPGLLSGVSPSPSTALQTLEYEFANDSFDSATDSPLSTIPDNGASNYKRARSPTITKMIDRSLRKRRTSSHKRLEKTAVGLRELARKIGEVDVKYGEDPPTNVLFACKLGDSSINHCIFAAVQFMISQNKVNTVFLQDQMFDQLEPPLKETLRKSYLMCSSKDPDSSDSDSTKKQLVLWQSEDFSRYSKEIELILSFGGDGTVLFASWLFQEKVPPIIPFNMGSLGFLTVFDSTSVEEVVNDNLANDKGIRMNLRMRFSCTIQRKDALKGDHQSCYQVLNDLVVDRGPSPFLSNLELFGNDSHLTTVQADGLVIATPTGSTACKNAVYIVSSYRQHAFVIFRFSFCRWLSCSSRCISYSCDSYMPPLFIFSSHDIARYDGYQNFSSRRLKIYCLGFIRWTQESSLGRYSC